MVRSGYLPPETREELTALVRDGKAESRVTRRANALLLLDDAMSCEAIAKVLYMDDDTIRYWHELYQEKGLKWLTEFWLTDLVALAGDSQMRHSPPRSKILDLLIPEQVGH